jgi:UDP-glucuronate decarboxylase
MNPITSKRIVVTGGTGFLSSHLCDRLLDAGAEVIGLDNFFTGSRSNVSLTRSSARCHRRVAPTPRRTKRI